MLVILTYNELEDIVTETTMSRKQIPRSGNSIDRARVARLGFRLDEQSRLLIERAAQLERRKLTEFCVSTLTEAARCTIADHETLTLSERDRELFFEVLVHPGAPNDRLKRAVAEERRRVEPWMGDYVGPDLRVEPLDHRHDRARFACGEDSLDVYLKKQASQDMRRKANAVFVLVTQDEPRRVSGYFTLCATALPHGHVPEEARRHVPRYPLVSATQIGRLAVAQGSQGRGLGGILLASALRRASHSAATVGSAMVVVDALNETAARFYAAYGFTRLPDSNRLILPMRLVEKALEPYPPSQRSLHRQYPPDKGVE
jgi:uncharacterized protein (DUF1778 family)/GNAT superfamily N-acetyltransferase